MALWTASLFNADGELCAALGSGMYAEGNTADEARADAERQLLVETPTQGYEGIELQFLERVNAKVRDMRARGYELTVRRKR